MPGDGERRHVAADEGEVAAGFEHGDQKGTRTGDDTCMFAGTAGGADAETGVSDQLGVGEIARSAVTARQITRPDQNAGESLYRTDLVDVADRFDRLDLSEEVRLLVGLLEGGFAAIEAISQAAAAQIEAGEPNGGNLPYSTIRSASLALLIIGTTTMRAPTSNARST